MHVGCLSEYMSECVYERGGEMVISTLASDFVSWPEEVPAFLGRRECQRLRYQQ